MNKYKFLYVHKSIPLDEGDRGYPISPAGQETRVTCAVCKRLGHFETDEQGAYITVNDIYVKHFMLHNDYLYLIPIFHPRCREMFNLNPLAYE